MKYIKQALWIAYFYAMGFGISFLTGGYIPGSIIGMILLYLALSLGWIKPSAVEEVSDFLLKYMVVLFIPPAVGLITAWGAISPMLIEILTATVLSTIITILIIGSVAQLLERRCKRQ